MLINISGSGGERVQAPHLFQSRPQTAGGGSEIWVMTRVKSARTSCSLSRVDDSCILFPHHRRVEFSLNHGSVDKSRFHPSGVMLRKKTAHVTVRSVVDCVHLGLLGLRDGELEVSDTPAGPRRALWCQKTQRSLHLVIESGVFRIP